MTKLNVSLHAIERARERFDAKGTNDNVSHTLRSWFTRAVRKGRDNASGIIFDNISKDVRMILDETCQTVVTVYRLSEVDDHTAQKLAPKLTVNRLASAIKREFERMQREVRREVRHLNEQLARLNIEVATLNLNKIRCKAPHTKSHIQARIDEMMAEAGELATVIDAKLTEIERAKTEVEGVVGE